MSAIKFAIPLSIILVVCHEDAAQLSKVLVEGVVSDGEGGPIPSVQVRLTTTRPAELRPVEFSAFTSADGRFQFEVPPGEYMLLAQRPGFYGPAVNGVPRANDTRRLRVAGDGPAEIQRLRLVPGGVITGRVVDQVGKVPDRITIWAMQVRYDRGRPSVVRVGTAETNELGEFRIYWVPPGDYYVLHEPALNSVATSTIVGPNSAILARTYFPGTSRLDSARMVSVSAGQEVQGIDFALQTTPSFKVSGLVLNPHVPAVSSAEIAAQPNFTLVSSDFSISEIVMSSFANSLPMAERQGDRFELRGIPPGHYELFALVRSPTLAVTYSGSIPIDVVTQDVKDLVISVHPPTDLKGRFTVNGNVRLLEKSKVSLRYDGSSRISAPLETEADANGEFSFKGLADGLYRISAVAPADTFVSDIRQGDHSIYSDNFVRIGGDAPLSVQIALASDPGSISGTVNQPSGKTGTDTTVVLVPEDARSNFVLYHSDQVDESGQFALNNIAPGRYKLFAWEGVFANAWLNPSFLSRYEDQGVPITIVTGKNSSARPAVIWLK